MNISEHWAVEYNSESDAFTVCTLADYLSNSQNAFREGNGYGGTILAIHPTEEGCREECDAWMNIRNKHPIPPEAKHGALLRRLLFQAGQEAMHYGGITLTIPPKARS